MANKSQYRKKNRNMNTRKASLAAVTAAFMLSTTNLSALGLGALEVKSNLDQPLDGTIELRVAAGDDVGSVNAAIANRDDFERLGIDYPAYLQDMSLSVENMGGGTYVLRVISNNVVIKEPFIHFLVRVDWSGGSFLREYTALIDPPVYAADTPQSVAEPRVVGTDEAFQTDPEPQIVAEELAPAPEAEVVDEVFSEPEPEEPVYEEPVAEQAPLEESSVEDEFVEDEFVETEPVAQADQELGNLPRDAQYGPVANGESLSVIAAELQRQFPDLSIYQIMQVLFEENRESFINENINGLMAGAVLSIGDLNAIRQVDVAQAKQFFYDQISQWDPSSLASSGDFDDGVGVGQDEYSFDDSIANTESESFDSSSFAEDTEAFQVGATTETAAAVSSGDAEARAAEVLAMQQQISELETSLVSSELENQELTERISLLEGQLDDMNRLISMDVESADLAAVEATLADQNNADSLDDVSAADDVTLDDFSSDELIDDTTTADVDSELGAETDSSGFIDPLTGIDDYSIDEEGADAAFDDGTGIDELTDTDTLVDDLAEESSDLAGDATDTVEVEEPAVSQAPAAKPKSFMSSLQSTVVDSGLWKILAGAGGLLLAGLGLWFMRRRRADEEFEISMMSIESQSQSEAEEHAVSVPEEDDKSKTADRETSFLTVYSDSDAVVQADEVDPVAEADVYIAYGRDEQAEEVLLDGIASKPGRVDIKQKLLTLYHKNNNVEGFERIAEELYSQKNFLTKNVWQEVSLMGKDLAPENPLFDVSASELLAEDETADNMITSGDSGEIEEPSALDAASSMTVEDDGSGVQFAEEDPSINLINFDDGNSEISEIDDVEIDALNLDDSDAKQQSDSGDSADGDIDFTEADGAQTEAEEEADSVFEIDFSDDADETAADISDANQADSDADQADADDADEYDNDAVSIQSVTEVSDLEIGEDYDEARTQYELAKVFVDLGDEDGARKILDDIVANESNSQDVLDDASKLLESINT